MNTNEITAFLAAAQAGDSEAFGRVFAAVYDELRRMARWRRRRQPHGTMSTTALVHETYLKLAGADIPISDRRHLLALIARAMRQVVVDYARERSAGKRGGDLDVVTLDPGDDSPPAVLEDQALVVLSVHAALDSLAEVDPRAARVVELRFFGGLSVEETAEVLGVSTPTVKRDARIGRAFLSRELAASPPGSRRGSV